MEVKTTRVRGPMTSYLYRKSNRELAPIMFFLHGFPDDAYTFNKQFEHFHDYDIVAPFLRGIPPSEGANTESRYHPDSILLDNLHILHEVDPERYKKVLIMAHDIGGVYGWDLARHLEKRVIGLIVSNGASIEQMARRISNWRQVMKSWYIFVFQVPGSMILWKKFEKKLMEQAYARGGAEALTRPERVSEGLLLYREAMGEVLKFLWNKKREAFPHKLFSPVLVLCSKDDPFLEEVSIEEAETLAHQFTIRYVEGGHWAHQLNSEKINHLIEKFLGESHADI